MNKLKTIAFFVFTFIATSLFAQENNQIDMAEGLYQSGKIYVVVGVLSIIFIGIIVYLIMLDKKISKLENQNKD